MEKEVSAENAHIERKNQQVHNYEDEGRLFLL